MTEKENALRILRFDKPQWVMSGLPTYSLCYNGCHHEGYAGGGHDCQVGSRWTDIWGTVWHKEHEGVMGFPRGNPLAEIGSLRTYRWPDPGDERISGKIYRLHREFGGGDVFLDGSHRDTLWEKSYMLVGMENMMEYFFTEPQYVREILHRIMDFQLAMARQYLSLGIETASLGDDLGTQAGPLLGPRIVEEFLVPEYRRLTELYRQRGVIINFHSCGNVESVIDVFLRLGIDVLNPAQATANDLDKLRALTAGRMALQGGVSTATIMAGPVEKIVQEVRRRLWQLGPEGGYFCAPDQGMPFPREHIEAVYETIRRYGRYPLSATDYAG
jgi:uroporphyrinogen decarboxylase